MKAELKQKWISALRSGNYLQTEGTLEKDGRNCCLGVLCRVMGLEVEHTDTIGVTFKATTDKYCITMRDSLSLFLRNDLGLTSIQEKHLIRLNDGGYDQDPSKFGSKTKPQPFSVIADWIEANVPAT